MQTERFDVALTLKAQQEGKAAFAETDAGLKVVRKAVQNFSEAQANGLGIAAAYKEAIASYKTDALEAGLTIEGEAKAIRAATRAIDEFRAAEASGLPFDEALVFVMEEQAIAARSNALAQMEQAGAADAASSSNVAKTGTSEASAAADEEEAASIFMLTGAIDALTGANWGQVAVMTLVVALIGAITAAIAPFIMVAYAGTGVILAMTVAAAGLLVLEAGVIAGFGGLAAGLVVLTNHFGWVNHQMAVFSDMLKRVGADWAKHAAPAVNQILKFLENLLPGVDRAGNSIIKWFSGEIPGVLKSVGRILHDLGPDFTRFGQFLGKAFDQTGKVGFGDLFKDSVRLAIGAVEGLVTNLLRLVNWLHSNPFGSAAQDAFGWLGDVIQSIGSGFQAFAAWVKENWPWIMGIAKDAIDKFGTAWSTEFGPALDNFGKTVGPMMLIMLKYVADHFDTIAGVVGLVATAIVALVFVLLALGVAFEAAVQFAEWAAMEISNAFDWVLKHAVDMINGVIAAYDKIPGVPHLDLIRLPNSATGPQDKIVSTHKPRALAGGGDVERGEIFLAGENGPELYVSHSGGTVIPHEEIGTAMAPDMGQIEFYLKLIEAHLAFIKQEAPAISATAIVRRSA